MNGLGSEVPGLLESCMNLLFPSWEWQRVLHAHCGLRPWAFYLLAEPYIGYEGMLSGPSPGHRDLQSLLSYVWAYGGCLGVFFHCC